MFSNKIITVKITVTKMFGLNLPIDVSFEGRPNVYLNELFLTSVNRKYAPQSESRDTKSIRRICSEIAWVHKASIKNNVALVQWSEWTRPAPSFVKDENRESNYMMWKILKFCSAKNNLWFVFFYKKIDKPRFQYRMLWSELGKLMSGANKSERYWPTYPSIYLPSSPKWHI